MNVAQNGTSVDSRPFEVVPPAMIASNNLQTKGRLANKAVEMAR